MSLYGKWGGIRFYGDSVEISDFGVEDWYEGEWNIKF